MKPSAYYDPNAITREIAAGRHREAIGGLWEEMGQLQLDFLKAEGLKPQHILLDIGCGALRFGHLAVDYLQSGHYYGQDISEALMQAGYEQELTPAQREKLPASHLAANDRFDFSHVERPVDVAIAQSVFTHLPLNHIRQCLQQLAPKMATGGAFYATWFECPANHPLHAPYPQPGAIDGQPVITTAIADPYHYRADDLAYAAADADWQRPEPANWHHPRGQKMLKFVKK